MLNDLDNLTKLDQELQSAIINLNVEKVKNSLEAGANSNSIFEYKKIKCSALALSIKNLGSSNAINKKIENMVSYLLKYNANPNSPYPMNVEFFKTLGNYKQPSLLEECILKGNYQIVKKLLSYGAKPHNYYAYDDVIFAISLDINRKEYFYIMLELIRYGVKFSLLIDKIIIITEQKIINNFNIHHMRSLEKCFGNKKFLNEYIMKSMDNGNENVINNIHRESQKTLDEISENYFHIYIDFMQKYKNLVKFIKDIIMPNVRIFFHNLVLISNNTNLEFTHYNKYQNKLLESKDHIDILNNIFYEKNNPATQELTVLMKKIKKSHVDVIEFFSDNNNHNNSQFYKKSILKSMLVKFINIYCTNIQITYNDLLLKH